LFRHAFPIVAHFDWALTVTFAAPEASLLPLVAPGLSLDAFKQRGFLAVACVKTRRLRPRGFPERIGMNFFLVGYRLFVQFNSSSGRRYRGLQILGSETDRWRMALGGRMFTHYRYRKVRATVARDHGAIHVATSTGLNMMISESANLPPGSVFDDAAEARRYGGPMPFTFASVRGGRAIARVEGRRGHWDPRLVAPRTVTAPFLSSLAPGAVPAAAFLVEDVDYEWKRGIVEMLPR
jgi:Uncharacterized conserved protein (COG2071)